MSKELRELLNQLSNKNEALIALNSKEGVTLDELTNASNEIDILQAKIGSQKKADEITKNFADNSKAEPIKVPGAKNVIYNGALFVKAIADNLLKQKNQRGLSFTDEEVNVITGSIGEDGGYAIPADIQTKINTILQDGTDLYNLTDFELVSANDLLRYADASLETWIINWFVEKVRVTRNFEILYGIGGDAHATGIFTTN